MALTEEELFNMSDEELSKLLQETEKPSEIGLSHEDTAMTEEVESNVSTEIDETEDTVDELLEQPEGQDSKDDDVDVDDSDEESLEESQEVESEGDTQQEEETTEDVETESKTETKTYKYKANGQEFEFTEEEIKEQFGKVFAQAMNYTKKMQAIAPYRKVVSAMEQENISEKDIYLLIDAIKGNKDAVAEIVRKAGVDVLDLDTDSETDAESSYSPNEYGLGEKEIVIKEIVDELQNDPQFPITQHVIGEQWDEASKTQLYNNPELIKELHYDISNGVFDKVSPMALKMKVLDGGRKSDIEYYIAAGQQYYSQQRESERDSMINNYKTVLEKELNQQKTVQQTQQKQEKLAKARQNRKAAAPSANSISNKSNSVTELFDDSDEAFEEWYRNLQDSL